jgi:hypothetical protein
MQQQGQHYITDVLIDIDGDRARRETAFVHAAALEDVFGGVPDTARVGDVYPHYPIYEADWDRG